MTPFKQNLKIGDKGEAVKSLQERLIQLKFNVCFVNGKVKHLQADEDFGIITAECLSSFQAKVIDASAQTYISKEIKDKYHFEADGIMRFADWWILENFEKLLQWYKANPEQFKIDLPEETTKDKIIKTYLTILQNEVGVMEEGGNNFGKRVEEYQLIGSGGVVKHGGSPWCFFFALWGLIMMQKELGLDFKWGSHSGYTPDGVNRGKKLGIAIINPKFNDIEIGDWFFIFSAQRNNAKHIGTILDKNNKNWTIKTVEGNITVGSDTVDGGGVDNKVRNIPWCIVKWWKLYE